MEAVVALIFWGNGILGVSRKEDTSLFGLVGGKVEKGETHAHALYREVEEETGLQLIKAKKIFSDFDGNMQTTTYLCEAEGKIQTAEKGVVKEVTWDELFAGPFGEYNRKVYNTLYHG
jgi:8-oxo-dGTP pyrophosphatase MutT (NUDIX family)